MDETRWTLRDMLLAFVWISVGLALLRHVWLRWNSTDGSEIAVMMLVHLGGCAAIGAGVGTIFKRRLLGAVLGFVVAPLLPCVLGVLGELAKEFVKQG